VLVRLTCACSGCDKELPQFQKLQAAYDAKGLRTVAVFKEKPDTAEFYANNFDDLQKLFGHWRGKGGSAFGLAPASKDAAPRVDPSRITGQGPAKQGAPAILDRIRNALRGYAPLSGE